MFVCSIHLKLLRNRFFFIKFTLNDSTAYENAKFFIDGKVQPHRQRKKMFNATSTYSFYYTDKEEEEGTTTK